VSAILIDATRCWRAARDMGDRVQPCLSRMLARCDCPMLAPVLDSLLSFYELAVGRPLQTGHADLVTHDEYRLVGLVDGSLPRRSCLSCPENAARGLDCAICSARIMMALATSGERGTRH
jgi:hypothetical protein